MVDPSEAAGIKVPLILLASMEEPAPTVKKFEDTLHFICTTDNELLEEEERRTSMESKSKRLQVSHLLAGIDRLKEKMIEWDKANEIEMAKLIEEMAEIEKEKAERDKVIAEREKEKAEKDKVIAEREKESLSEQVHGAEHIQAEGTPAHVIGHQIPEHHHMHVGIPEGTFDYSAWHAQQQAHALAQAQAAAALTHDHGSLQNIPPALQI